MVVHKLDDGLAIPDALRASPCAAGVADVTELVSYLLDQIESFPSGVDYEADPQNLSPEDAFAHSAGLMWQACTAFLKASAGSPSAHDTCAKCGAQMRQVCYRLPVGFHSLDIRLLACLSCNLVSTIETHSAVALIEV